MSEFVNTEAVKNHFVMDNAWNNYLKSPRRDADHEKFIMICDSIDKPIISVNINGDTGILFRGKLMTLDYSLFGLGITGFNCPELRSYQESPKI